MKMSQPGRAKLIVREGKRNKAYPDTKGVWTIGVGHTAAAGGLVPTPGMVITDAQVDALLAHDLPHYENIVNKNVRVPLTQGQFDALVSICFNVERALMPSSTIVKRLNAGNYRGAADAILMWNQPPEIRGRRKGEYQQFLAATTQGQPGTPVRFVAAADLDEGEDVSVDYLRASGSRTISAADRIKQGAMTIGAGDALDMASRAKGYVDQAKDLVQGWDAGAPVSELASSYWPLFIGLAAGLAIAGIAFLAYRAAHRIQLARVEDAIRPEPYAEPELEAPAEPEPA